MEKRPGPLEVIDLAEAGFQRVERRHVGISGEEAAPGYEPPMVGTPGAPDKPQTGAEQSHARRSTITSHEVFPTSTVGLAPGPPRPRLLRGREGGARSCGGQPERVRGLATGRDRPRHDPGLRAEHLAGDRGRRLPREPDDRGPRPDGGR